MASVKFATIKLKIKAVGDLAVSEIEQRELIFGNSQSALFIKNLSDSMLTIPTIDDSTSSATTTWSSNKIIAYVTSVLP